MFKLIPGGRARASSVRAASVVLVLVLLLVTLSPTTAQEEPADPARPPASEVSVGSEPTPVATATPVPTPAPTPVPVLSEADIAERAAPSVVRVVAGSSSGSGVKIDRGILTNEHVTSGASNVEIVTADGRRFNATVSRSSRRYDLALLSTDASIPPLEMEPARSQRQGDTVLALGYPRTGALGAGQATLTRGLISAIRENPEGVLHVQTDAALNAGSSGGALVNMRGKLLGISSASVRGSEGLGLAVATESIEAFLTGPEEATRPLPRTSSAPNDPAGSIIGQTTTVCEGALRFELQVEDAVQVYDGTVHLLVRARNTGSASGNLLLKFRLQDDRDRSFNMVNPRDRFVLGDIYGELLALLRRNGANVIGPDAPIRAGESARVYVAFLGSTESLTLRLVPDSPCG